MTSISWTRCLSSGPWLYLASAVIFLHWLLCALVWFPLLNYHLQSMRRARHLEWIRRRRIAFQQRVLITSLVVSLLVFEPFLSAVDTFVLMNTPDPKEQHSALHCDLLRRTSGHSTISMREVWSTVSLFNLTHCLLSSYSAAFVLLCYLVYCALLFADWTDSVKQRSLVWRNELYLSTQGAQNEETLSPNSTPTAASSGGMGGGGGNSAMGSSRDEFADEGRSGKSDISGGHSKSVDSDRLRKKHRKPGLILQTIFYAIAKTKDESADFLIDEWRLNKLFVGVYVGFCAVSVCFTLFLLIMLDFIIPLKNFTGGSGDSSSNSSSTDTSIIGSSSFYSGWFVWGAGLISAKGMRPSLYSLLGRNDHSSSLSQSSYHASFSSSSSWSVSSRSGSTDSHDDHDSNERMGRISNMFQLMESCAFFNDFTFFLFLYGFAFQALRRLTMQTIHFRDSLGIHSSLIIVKNTMKMATMICLPIWVLVCVLVMTMLVFLGHSHINHLLQITLTVTYLLLKYLLRVIICQMCPMLTLMRPIDLYPFSVYTALKIRFLRENERYRRDGTALESAMDNCCRGLSVWCPFCSYCYCSCCRRCTHTRDSQGRIVRTPDPRIQRDEGDSRRGSGMSGTALQTVNSMTAKWYDERAKNRIRLMNELHRTNHEKNLSMSQDSMIGGLSGITATFSLSDIEQGDVTEEIVKHATDTLPTHSATPTESATTLPVVAEVLAPMVGSHGHCLPSSTETPTGHTTDGRISGTKSTTSTQPTPKNTHHHRMLTNESTPPPRDSGNSRIFIEPPHTPVTRNHSDSRFSPRSRLSSNQNVTPHGKGTITDSTPIDSAVRTVNNTPDEEADRRRRRMGGEERKVDDQELVAGVTNADNTTATAITTHHSLPAAVIDHHLKKQQQQRQQQKNDSCYYCCSFSWISSLSDSDSICSRIGDYSARKMNDLCNYVHCLLFQWLDTNDTYIVRNNNNHKALSILRSSAVTMVGSPEGEVTTPGAAFNFDVANSPPLPISTANSTTNVKDPSTIPKLTLAEVLSTRQGFEAMAEHMAEEFTLESLLFLFEYSAVKMIVAMVGIVDFEDLRHTYQSPVSPALVLDYVRRLLRNTPIQDLLRQLAEHRRLESQMDEVRSHVLGDVPAASVDQSSECETDGQTHEDYLETEDAPLSDKTLRSNSQMNNSGRPILANGNTSSGASGASTTGMTGGMAMIEEGSEARLSSLGTSSPALMADLGSGLSLSEISRTQLSGVGGTDTHSHNDDDFGVLLTTPSDRHVSLKDVGYQTDLYQSGGSSSSDSDSTMKSTSDRRRMRSIMKKKTEKKKKKKPRIESTDSVVVHNIRLAAVPSGAPVTPDKKYNPAPLMDGKSRRTVEVYISSDEDDDSDENNNNNDDENDEKGSQKDSKDGLIDGTAASSSTHSSSALPSKSRPSTSPLASSSMSCPSDSDDSGSKVGLKNKRGTMLIKEDDFAELGVENSENEADDEHDEEEDGDDHSYKLGHSEDEKKDEHSDLDRSKDRPMSLKDRTSNTVSSAVSELLSVAKKQLHRDPMVDRLSADSASCSQEESEVRTTDGEREEEGITGDPAERQEAEDSDTPPEDRFARYDGRIMLSTAPATLFSQTADFPDIADLSELKRRDSEALRIGSARPVFAATLMFNVDSDGVFRQSPRLNRKPLFEELPSFASVSASERKATTDEEITPMVMDVIHRDEELEQTLRQIGSPQKPRMITTQSEVLLGDQIFGREPKHSSHAHSPRRIMIPKIRVAAGAGGTVIVPSLPGMPLDFKTPPINEGDETEKDSEGDNHDEDMDVPDLHSSADEKESEVRPSRVQFNTDQMVVVHGMGYFSDSDQCGDLNSPDGYESVDEQKAEQLSKTTSADDFHPPIPADHHHHPHTLALPGSLGIRQMSDKEDSMGPVPVSMTRSEPKPHERKITLSDLLAGRAPPPAPSASASSKMTKAKSSAGSQSYTTLPQGSKDFPHSRSMTLSQLLDGGAASTPRTTRRGSIGGSQTPPRSGPRSHAISVKRLSIVTPGEAQKMRAGGLKIRRGESTTATKHQRSASTMSSPGTAARLIRGVGSSSYHGRHSAMERTTSPLSAVQKKHRSHDEATARYSGRDRNSLYATLPMSNVSSVNSPSPRSKSIRRTPRMEVDLNTGQVYIAGGLEMDGKLLAQSIDEELKKRARRRKREARARKKQDRQRRGFYTSQIRGVASSITSYVSSTVSTPGGANHTGHHHGGGGVGGLSSGALGTSSSIHGLVGHSQTYSGEVTMMQGDEQSYFGSGNGAASHGGAAHPQSRKASKVDKQEESPMELFDVFQTVSNLCLYLHFNYIVEDNSQPKLHQQGSMRSASKRTAHATRDDWWWDASDMRQYSGRTSARPMVSRYHAQVNVSAQLKTKAQERVDHALMTFTMTDMNDVALAIREYISALDPIAAACFQLIKSDSFARFARTEEYLRLCEEHLARQQKLERERKKMRRRQERMRSRKQMTRKAVDSSREAATGITGAIKGTTTTIFGEVGKLAGLHTIGNSSSLQVPSEPLPPDVPDKATAMLLGSMSVGNSNSGPLRMTPSSSRVAPSVPVIATNTSATLTATAPSTAALMDRDSGDSQTPGPVPSPGSPASRSRRQSRSMKRLSSKFLSASFVE